MSVIAVHYGSSSITIHAWKSKWVWWLNAMLAVKRLVGVAPEMNLNNHRTELMKIKGYSCETQARCHQMTKPGVPVASQSTNV